MTSDRAIWKFELDGFDPIVEMPAGAHVCGFGHQGGKLVLWAIVDPAAPRLGRSFHVVGTGWEFRPSLTYRGMVQMPDGLVWHLLEV